MHRLQDQIRILRFFQRTFKCIDQMMRQLPDKAYRICQKNLLPTWQLPASCRRIKSCKKLILLQHTGSGQCVEKRGLSGIGITDNCHDRDPVLRPLFACQFPVSLHLPEFTVQLCDPVLDESPVHLQLLFSRSSGSDSTSQT